MPGEDNGAYVLKYLLSKLASLSSGIGSGLSASSGDIELPNESGEMDPRLLAAAKTPGQKMKAGYRYLRDTKR